MRKSLGLLSTTVLLSCLCVVSVFAQGTPQATPQATKDSYGLFEWFLDTWVDVKTDTSHPDAVAKNQIAKCAHCHVTENRWQVPRIPFDNEEKFKAWLKQKHTYKGKTYLGDKLVIKLVWTDQHMPKKSKGIEYQERKAIKTYVQKLMSQ